jgi:hypothetical protein
LNSALLPPWLPDWDDADAIARSVNAMELKSTIQALVDLVLTEDTQFLDSLQGDLESALISPLDTLAQIYDSSNSLVELVVASRLVRRSAIPYLRTAPEELKLLIQALPE